VKVQHLFEIDTICDILNVFTVTFYQFNASLLNNINLKNRLKKKRTDPNHLNKINNTFQTLFLFAVTGPNWTGRDD